jgi:hypothetical protein
MAFRPLADGISIELLQNGAPVPRPSRGRRCPTPAPGEPRVTRRDRHFGRHSAIRMGWLQVDLRGLRVPVPHDSGWPARGASRCASGCSATRTSPGAPPSRSRPRSRCSSCARPRTHYTYCSTLTSV